jgi:hypothetical protein
MFESQSPTGHTFAYGFLFHSFGHIVAKMKSFDLWIGNLFLFIVVKNL